MMPAPIAALALSLALSQASPAAPAALPVLTLDDALTRAAGSNLDLKVAEARLEQARAGVGKAWSGYLPQVTAGASWTHNSDAASITLPTGYHIRDLGTPQGPPTGDPDVEGAQTNLKLVPAGAITAEIQRQDQLGAQVQVSQALLAPGLWFGIRAARQGAAAAEKSVDAARRDVLFGVAQVYYGVTSLKKLVEVSERLLEIARRQERDAEVRYKAGTIAKVGYLRAEIDRARAEQDLVRSRNAFDSARVQLATLLDRDAAFDVAEPADPPAPSEAAELEREALAERADLKAARLAEEVAASLRTATAMRYLPSLGAFGRWQISNVGGFTGQSDSWAVGLGINWTLFDGGLREAELRDAGARVAEATAARRSAEAKALAEVRQALLDWESAKANAVKAREQRDLAAENQRLVDVSFKAGAATAVEQADATATLRNAEIAATTEALQAQLAALRVLKAAGEFAPPARRGR
jgi:outer membrane protein TolC